MAKKRNPNKKQSESRSIQEEKQAGFGNPKLEGPNRPST
jgi:hypothetical protein